MRNCEMRDLTPDLTRPTPSTDADFLRLVQKSILPIRAETAKRESRDLKVRFDEIYRAFVYKTLLAARGKGGFGFKEVRQERGSGAYARVPMRDGLSGEDVYSAVYEKLFGPKGLVCNAALLKFDAGKDRVGQGAFRKYLREVIRSVVMDMTKKEYIKKKDTRGRVIYRVYESGPKKGQYMLDAKGRKIPEMALKYQTVDEDVLAVAGSGYRETTAKVSASVYRRKLDIHYLAYTVLHECLKKTGWFYEASAQIYEKGIPREIILMECVKRGVICDRRAFDKAISIFSRKVLAKAKELEREVCSDHLVRSADGRTVLSESQRIDQAWEKVAEMVGSCRVQDIRARVMRGLLKDVERKMDEEAS